MRALTSAALPATMTSREIAELTGKRHDNVMADIRKMLVELHGEVGLLSFQDTHANEQNGLSYPVFRLPKRETLILVSGYSIAMRAKIVDRWQELEQQPDPMRVLTDPAAMRTLLLGYTERVLALEHQVDDLAPKAAALERISASDEAVTMTQAAKVLGVKRERLTSWMHEHGWIYRQNGSWVAYRQHIENGRLQYKEAHYTDDKTHQECLRPYCHILPKGLAKLAQAFAAQEAA